MKYYIYTMNKGKITPDTTPNPDFSAQINKIARGQSSITFTFHVREQMAARKITFRHIYSLFRGGVVVGNLSQQKSKWNTLETRFRIEGQIGARDMAAIAVVAENPDSLIYVITVFDAYGGVKNETQGEKISP